MENQEINVQDLFNEEKPAPEYRPRKSALEFMKESHEDFYKKMFWDHGITCLCKKWNML